MRCSSALVGALGGAIDLSVHPLDSSVLETAVLAPVWPLDSRVDLEVLSDCVCAAFSKGGHKQGGSAEGLAAGRSRRGEAATATIEAAACAGS